MASYISPFPAIPPANPPSQNHISIPLSATQPSAVDGETEEWEYEYSTTETETYYVTLDLSTPSTTSFRAPYNRGRRGGFKAAWINPTRPRAKQPMIRASTLSLPKARAQDIFSDQNAANVDEEEIEDDDEVGDNFGADGKDGPIENEPVLPTTAKKGSLPGTIQILDLHTDNPMIAYKDHIFSCSWAQNIGTELLFTFRDRDNPLPVVRSLPDDVDLLAASSARITSKCVTLTANNRLSDEFETNKPQPIIGKLGSLQTKPGRPTVPRSIREEQASFLRRLSNLKQAKGESDRVTTNSQKRLFSNQWLALWTKKREDERKKLRSMVERGGPTGQKAGGRLAEMDKEDSLREQVGRSKEENRLAKVWTQGRKSKAVDGDGTGAKLRRKLLLRQQHHGRRGEGGGGGEVRGGDEREGGTEGGRGSNLGPNGPQADNYMSGVATAGENRAGISIPTPNRWDDLNYISESNDSDDDMVNV